MDRVEREHRGRVQAQGGGIEESPVRKTFLVRPRTPENERIDIEVQKGMAFVPDAALKSKVR